MATVEELKTAIGCLSAVFPQYVAKELAALTDQIATSIQGFTDPLAAIGDLQVDKLIDDVGLTSAGDIFGNMAGVAAGLGTQYVKREITDYVNSMSIEAPSVTKRVQAIRNLSGQIGSSVGLMMSLFSDLPYAAAQRMCQTVVDAGTTKVENLTCLNKHIIQLVNAILALVKNGATYKETTVTKLTQVSAYLTTANKLLGQSQRLTNETVVFDTKVYGRARAALLNADGLIAPPKEASTIMDLPAMMDFGSVPTGGVTPSDEQLTRLILPSLMSLIEQEVSAVVTQVQVINFFVTQISAVVINYRAGGSTTQVKAQRARVIKRMRQTLTELIARVDLAVTRGLVGSSLGEMLAWSSRIKSILVTMESVKDLELREGSTLTTEKAAELAEAYRILVQDLRAITNAVATEGIENPLTMRDQVFALTKGGRRLLQDIENGRIDENHLATFHRLALNVATSQASKIQQSTTVAVLQAQACAPFLDLDIGVGERFDDLTDSMRQLGMDRGVDLLNAGAFADFLDTDLQMLSYVGTAIECLRHGIEGTEDAQTRQQLGRMRDDLIGKRSNLEIAAADSADQGRSRFIDKAKARMADLQKNAKLVETIVNDFRQLLSAAGENLDQSLEGLSQFSALLGNLDHLAVAAGGRLAGKLEEFSAFPNAGVVDCE